MSLNVKEIEYKNFGKCLSIDNGKIEAIVTVDVGPRVISFGFCGKPNIFYNDINRKYSFNGEKIRNYYGENSANYKYGGHNFTTIPEQMPNSFYPDNDPVMYSVDGSSAVFTPPTQRCNDIELSLEIIMNESATDIMLIHSLKNCATDNQVLGLSGATYMAPGGLMVVPQNTVTQTDYLPNRSFALWPFSKMDDKRVFIGNKYITIQQDTSISDKYKIGTNNYSNWAAYLNKGFIFKKSYVHNIKAKYPDFNSSFEVMTDSNLLEIKTLSPLYDIEPESVVRHVENWSLSEYEEMPQHNNEKQIDMIIKSI